jgi:phospholipid/cholesterol/gamma-HCH transport system substrate-binding protein
MSKLNASVNRVVVLVVVLAVVVGAAYFAFFRGSNQKTVKAQFVQAVGIYTGTPVKILGVPVGTVTGVKPGPAYVTVTIEYDSKYKLSPSAGAQEVANSLVSDRYIQLGPLYSDKADHGRALPSKATIPTSRTSGPEELDDIYSALNKLTVALGPNGANRGGKSSGALSTLLTVGAANLKGNGAALGNSITQLSRAAQTLANGRGDLFQTVQNLAKFTSTLQSSDGQIRKFETQLAQVAGDLASERSDLGGALNQLGATLDAINTFVKKNAGRFHTDIVGLEQITSVLARQKASLNETLAIAPIALANLIHTYQPEVGGLGTRSNLASLTDGLSTQALTQAVCGTLTSIGGGTGVGGLLGGLLKGVCK